MIGVASVKMPPQQSMYSIRDLCRNSPNVGNWWTCGNGWAKQTH